MELAKQIVAIISIALPLLITTLTFLSKFIKSAKAKKRIENLQKISNAIIPYMQEAEKFLNYTGTEKKEYVMERVAEFAEENKIPFDSDKMSELIEQLVEMTKEVNKRDKDKISDDNNNK